MVLSRNDSKLEKNLLQSSEAAKPIKSLLIRRFRFMLISFFNQHNSADKK